jgi:hypothetical protein
MRCTVLVPDGWSIRSVLLAPFARQVSARGPVDVLHLIPDDLLPVFTSRLAGDIHWQRLVPPTERRTSYILRKLLQLAHVRWVDTRSMRHLWKLPPTLPIRARATRRAAVVLAGALGSARAIRLLKRLFESVARHSPQVEHYRNVLREHRPGLVCSAHQRPLAILAPVLAARDLGIGTATFILSWDNLSGKGRIVAPFDHYLVWSDLMRRELRDYYPEVSESAIHVVGAPQFDFHADDTLLLPRAEFFEVIGADPERPVICYAGSDEITAPEEPDQLRILMKLIEQGRIQGDPQVVLRLHPADGRASRFDEAVRAHRNLILAAPAWELADPRVQRSPEEEGNAACLVPLPRDMQLLANLAHHCDVNVNIASTVTLDFAIRDKPVVNIGFDVATPPVLGEPLREVYYRFEHYRPVIELGAARLARSPQELADHVNAYLRDPSLDRRERRQLVELQLGVEVGDAGRAAAEVLEAIAA